MEIFTGRPENSDNRLEREMRVYDLLDSLGIEYQRVDHEAAMTMEACEAVDEALETVMCKNLFLCNRQKTEFYLLLMPGDKKFKTKFNVLYIFYTKNYTLNVLYFYIIALYFLIHNFMLLIS
jgi:Ala-tRNA(Pro) deacylase